EMKTGEGKTLVCTLPAYLNALTGKGVHVVTVNDHLAQRDAEWMGGLYNFLGLSVGVIAHGQNRADKQAAYQADITYGTNNEFGFDYLRDNMTNTLENRVHRTLNYAIVDEVDSILVDEARTPLIISAQAEQSTDKYVKYSKLIDQLQENEDYNIDETAKSALLSEAGIAKMEKLMGVENIYTDAGFEEVHHIEQALKAKTVYQKDIDYVVKDDRVIIVDQFTGRLMEGRRYSAGLHQAIEAKEGAIINRESKTLATITFQNYFRIFEKLAGMTGTAITEAEEFATIYGLETLVIPTNKPITRKDLPDTIYRNTKGKYLAIAKKVKELNAKGQPVLIGTISIEKSELLSKLLSTQGVKHKVLNAKHHEQEAEIVAKAGQKDSVTIATNMAGRGTDIKLGKEVIELGGLYVIGTERHESRRIDNQLRGRSGRQGDPGVTQFYISMEDDLMRMFGSDRVKSVMEKLGIPEDMPIENGVISKSIESAQKKVEGRNFDIRKHLVEYDDVMNTHREIMYRKRSELLEKEDISEGIKEMINAEANYIVMAHANLESKDKWNYKEMAETLSNLHRESSQSISEDELRNLTLSDDLVEKAQEFLQKEYEEKKASLPNPEMMKKLERAVAFRVIDTLWMQHIDDMSKLRDRVALRGYGQRDPLIEYKGEAFEMFSTLNGETQHQTISTLFKVKVKTVDPQMVSPLTENLRTNEAQIQGTLQGGSLRNQSAKEKNIAKSAANFVAATAGPVSQGSTMASKQGEVTVVSADEPTPGMSQTPEGSTSESAQPTVIGASDETKIGRNDPCPCGSGKKYKKCCG
ncbi:MAG: preprotein translocase subunit SecA, partial [Candidatus Peregrinibacteria bacterium]|nr:preprotein translocase subunit SecA [Candidatus Peregrinibacteria bacterium]